MKYLLYTLQILYLFLFLMTDLVPKNRCVLEQIFVHCENVAAHLLTNNTSCMFGRWNSLWISAIFVFCTTGFWAISERYGNPMKLRSKMMVCKHRLKPADKRPFATLWS